VLVVVSTASAGAPERHAERATIDGWGFAECDGFDIIATGGFSFDAGRHPFSTIGVDRCEHVAP
jgi:hypothetical protein